MSSSRLLQVSPRREAVAGPRDGKGTGTTLNTLLATAEIKENVLLTLCLPLTTPCNLQYIEKKELKDDLQITLSDGRNCKDYLISKKFAFLFRNEKILINSVITVLEIKKKKNKQIIMEIRLKKQKSQKKFGNPKKL